MPPPFRPAAQMAPQVAPTRMIPFYIGNMSKNEVQVNAPYRTYLNTMTFRIILIPQCGFTVRRWRRPMAFIRRPMVIGIRDSPKCLKCAPLSRAGAHMVPQMAIWTLRAPLSWEKVVPLEHHAPPPFADFWLRRC